MGGAIETAADIGHAELARAIVEGEGQDGEGQSKPPRASRGTNVSVGKGIASGLTQGGQGSDEKAQAKQMQSQSERAAEDARSGSGRG